MRTERVEWFHGREVAVGGMVVGANGWGGYSSAVEERGESHLP